MKNPISQSSVQNDFNVPNQAWGLFLISILGLFLELLFIRWIGTEIRIFAYLQNTILVVCFLGLGIGMFTSAKIINLRQILIPMTFILFLMAWPFTRTGLDYLSEMLGVLGDSGTWIDRATDNMKITVMALMVGLVLTYFLLALIVDMFVPVGRILGRLMNVHPKPIWAYSVNIAGSLVGTWIFVVLSYLYQPPFTWFLITGMMLLLLILLSKKDTKINLILLGCTILLSWFVSQSPGALSTVWSPYQKLVVLQADGSNDHVYMVTVNNTGYQAMVDLSRSHVLANQERYPPEFMGLSQYDLPALFHPNPQSMLIVGAGAGNDAAGALRHNVPSITAVEIDPAIIAIGRELHPERPYSSPQVQLVNDDARSFFATTSEKYDVISFGLLDSHTATAMTNARLDHYVYTIESISQAKSRLNPRGIVVLSFEAQKPFIADRIRLALREVFGQDPLVFRIPPSQYGFGGVIFVSGDQETIQKQLDANIDLTLYVNHFREAYPLHFSNNTKITSDDWPYIYLESPKIPTLYYLLAFLMILLLVRSLRKWEARTSIHIESYTFWHFFFLGAAFLLLEVQNISKASVVLGNTWLVNAVIISSILGMALLANWIAYRFPPLPLPIVYSLLIGVCIALYFVDLARFGFLPYFTKAIIVGALTSLPMLFSGIVFIRSFAAANEKSSALGANLIGALVGALLQSVTFIIGIKALLLIVAGFYFLSLLTGPTLQDQKASLAQPITE